MGGGERGARGWVVEGGEYGGRGKGLASKLMGRRTLICVSVLIQARWDAMIKKC